MIHNFYILKSNGICIFHEKYGSLEEDPQAIAGFLTAVSMFAEAVVGEPIKNIETSNHKFIFYSDKGYLFVAFVDKSDPFHSVQNFLRRAEHHLYDIHPELTTLAKSDPVMLDNFRNELEFLINSL